MSSSPRSCRTGGHSLLLGSRGPWGSCSPSFSPNVLLLPGMTQTQGNLTLVSQRTTGQPPPPRPPTWLKSTETPTQNVHAQTICHHLSRSLTPSAPARSPWPCSRKGSK